MTRSPIELSWTANKVDLNFDSRNGAKKSGHLDHLLWPNIFRYISAKAGLLWFITSYIKTKKIVKDLHWTTSGLRKEWLGTPKSPEKMFFFFRKCDFGDLGFPLVILVNKSQKALCLSSKMVYQHLLCLHSLWTY